MSARSLNKGIPSWLGGASTKAAAVLGAPDLTQDPGYNCIILGRRHRNKSEGKSARLLLNAAHRVGLHRSRRSATLRLLLRTQTLEVRISRTSFGLRRPSRTIIAFADIEEIQVGKHSHNFQRYGKDINESLCFSIKVKSNERLKFASMDVVCGSASERDKVTSQISVAVARARWFSDPLNAKSQLSKQRDVFWAEQFRKFDLNGDGMLSLEELEHMLLHMGFPETSSEVAFGMADEKGNLRMTVEQFIEFCHQVRAAENLRPIFDEYCRRQDLEATDPELKSEGASINQSESVGVQTVPIEKPTKTTRLRMLGLQLFLEDQGEGDDNESHCMVLLERFGVDDNTSLDFPGFCDYVLSTRMNSVTKYAYVDDDLPLCKYLISSSHNTYLLADQLSGSCGIIAYINAYRQGFRCVEVDTHDSKRGPCITHGNTLTERLSFEEFVKVTKEYAFRHSHHPVIISLENHCSRQHEAMMAEYMKNIWGDENIYRWSSNQAEVATELPSLHVLRRKYILKAKVVPGVTHPELADLVFLKSTSGKSESMLSAPGNQMVSFDEEVAKQDIGPVSSLCKQFAATHLVRVYPKGRRVYSSNFNPIHAWCRGYQLAAMNCQTHCQKYRINQVLFQDTGGYLPLDSIGKLPIDEGHPLTTIRIVMGYLLPRSKVRTKLPRLKVGVFLYDVLSPKVRLPAFWETEEHADREDDDAEEEEPELPLPFNIKNKRMLFQRQHLSLEESRNDGNIAGRRLLQEDANEEPVILQRKKSTGSRRRRQSTSEGLSKRKAKLLPDFETDVVVGNSFNPVFEGNVFEVPPYTTSSMIVFVVTDVSTNNKVRAFGGAMMSRLKTGIRPLQLLDPTGVPFDNGTCLLLDVKKRVKFD